MVSSHLQERVTIVLSLGNYYNVTSVWLSTEIFAMLSDYGYFLSRLSRKTMTNNLCFQLLKNGIDKAYAPYSNFRVSAVVFGESGEMYVGVNVENAAYPQGWCAEASALGAMIMGGEHRLTKIAVMAEGDQICTPCGGCRQKIKEFAVEGTKILCYSPEELRATFTLDELLPHGFGATYLP